MPGTGQRPRPRGGVAVLAVLMCALLAAEVHAEPSCVPGRLPPRFERLVASEPKTFGLLDYLRHAAPEAITPARLAERCRRRLLAAAADCAAGRTVRAIGCNATFARMANALARRGAGSDPSRAPFVGAAESVGEVALLVRIQNRQAHAPCPCEPPTEAAWVPAIVTPLGDGSALRLEPATALAPGARYRLDSDLEGVAAPTWVEAEGWAAAVRDVDDRAFVERVLAAARTASGESVRPVVLLCGSRPRGLRELAHATVGFRRVAEHASPPPSAMVIDTGGQGLVAGAERVRRAAAGSRPGEVIALGTPAADAIGFGASRLPHVAAVVRGRFVSLDAARDTPYEVDYLLSVPRLAGARQATAVVMLLHSLDGSGRAFLLAHADELAARGLAAGAFDLPAHGGRATGVRFLDPLDPLGLAANLRQATFDAIAFATALRGGHLASGRLGPEPIRVFGYSVGAMTATLALGAAPELGTAVLVAPSGDLAFWLGPSVWRALRGGGRGAPAVAPVEGSGPCAPEPIDPAALRPTALANAYRTALADVDPQAMGGLAVGPNRRRPILILEGARDEMVTAASTERLAAALGADMTCRLRPEAPQVLCRFATLDHRLLADVGARTRAYEFLATAGHTLSAGAELTAR